MLNKYLEVTGLAALNDSGLSFIVISNEENGIQFVCLFVFQPGITVLSDGVVIIPAVTGQEKSFQRYIYKTTIILERII